MNELFARLGRGDPELAEHGRRALEFYRRERGGPPDGPALAAYVERLADLHLGETDGRELALAHWHVPAMEDFSPLWIRQAIVGEMKRLAGRRAALLLVTGLREAVCPEGRRWTRARAREYGRVREWIDELACAWATKGSQLQVVVL
ncbi:MAG: hypothetical protein ACOC4K_05685 [Verrucomicrobiota bacterium]